MAAGKSSGSGLGARHVALVLVLAGSGLALGGAVRWASGRGAPTPAVAAAAPVARPPSHAIERPKERLRAAPITDKLRNKGYHECNPPDPMGLGPYAPWRRLVLGRIAIPQRGGHDSSFGYDVIVHFHGADPIRKTLVQVARGVAFVGIDRGMGSGRYQSAFERKEEFPRLRRSIERALKEHTGQPSAHIRHLALSAWSAGYGAINEILRHGDEGIEAVVFLDGPHAGWKNGARRDGTVRSVSGLLIEPTIAFARKAVGGERTFIMTHSWVDPETYPSTALTAELIEQELGVQPVSARQPSGLLEQVRAVDVRGLHIWAFRGHDERVHCAHISLIARAVRDVLEEQWDTPEMDRSVPSTPAPKLAPAEASPRDAGVCETESLDGGPDPMDSVQEGTDPVPMDTDSVPIDTEAVDPVPLDSPPPDPEPALPAEPGPPPPEPETNPVLVE